MANVERIDIVIREDGSRVVQRRLEDIGRTAGAAVDPLSLMRRALGLVAGALAINKVKEYADAWAAATGLIATATKTQAEAAAVTQAVFEAAQRTRTPLTEMSELYSRVARVGGELGVSQAEIIKFTEGVGKALAVQGTSAQKAQGALLQLGQALGGGIVRAEEYNSINEAAPYILQLVAKNIEGVDGSLAKLRQRMIAGKLTSQEFFQAFQKGQGQLDKDFAKAPQTIAQSITLIENALMKAIGQFDQFFGVSATIGKAAKFIADNFDLVVESIGRITTALVTGAAAWATYRGALAVGSIVEAGRAALELSRAVASGNAVLLGSAQAERMRAAATAEAAAQSAVASAAARTSAAQEAVWQAEVASEAVAAKNAKIAAANAAAVAEARAAAVTAEAVAAEVTARQAAIVAAREQLAASATKLQADIAAARGAIAAAEASGAQRVGLLSVAQATEAVVAAERQHTTLMIEITRLDRQRIASTAAQTEALTAQTAAQTALNNAQRAAAAAPFASAAATSGAASALGGAKAELEAAKAAEAAAKVKAAAAASGVAAANATASVSFLAQVWQKVSGAASAAFGVIARGFALLNAHPFVALATAIVVTTGLLLGFGDKLDAGIDGITSMRDVLQAFGESALDVLKGVGDFLGTMWNGLVDGAKAAFDFVSGLIPSSVRDWLTSAGGFFDGVGEGFAGILRGTARVFDAMGGFITAYLLVFARGFAGLPEAVIGSFKRLYNGSVSILEDLLNTLIDGLNKVRSAIGQTTIDAVKFTKLDVQERTFEQLGADLGKSLADGFEAQGGYFEKAANNLLGRAQEISKKRAEEAFRKGEKDYANNAVDLNKPMGNGSGPLPDPNADKAAKKLARELQSLLGAIAPVDDAVNEFTRGLEVLHAAFAKGMINGEQYDRYVELLGLHYRDLIDPLGAVNRELDKQDQLLLMNADAREVESKFEEIRQDLTKKGVRLDAQAAAALRERLAASQEFAKQAQTEDQLLGQSVERRKEYVRQLQTIQRLLADPKSGFTQLDALRTVASEIGTEALRGTKAEIDLAIGTLNETYDKIAKARDAGVIDPTTADQAMKNATLDYQTQLQNSAPDLFAGTQEQLDLQAARFQKMYEQIDAFRQADLISEQTAIQMRAKVDAEKYAESLKNAEGFFGALSSLSESKNRELAAIGKAAAITEATIQGVVAVQRALAAYPPPVNYAMAAAVGVAAAANVAKIAGIGFESGGYTGDGGRSEVAGVVHGKEFVVNANGTAKNRPLLERMNRGEDLTAGGGAGSAGGAGSGGSGSQLGVRVINVMDPRMVEDYLATSEGEQVLLNVLRRNGSELKTIVTEGA